MAIRPIIVYPAPILLKRATIVPPREEWAALHQDLLDTMLDHNGVGIAAPQIGLPYRVMMVRVGQEKRGILCVDPAILLSYPGLGIESEGCLSLPGIRADVVRAVQIKVRFQTITGETLRDTVEGFPARVFQHEVDHLDGKLFIDRLSSQKREEMLPLLEKLKATG
jgi:peptide deformylase